MFNPERSFTPPSIERVPRHGFLTRHRDVLAVFGFALGLRLVFAALMAGTYDPDEFVYLGLARDMAHGAVPYRDFMLFQPPGFVAFLRILDPLTSLWWPLARIAIMGVDSITAALVWRIGLELYGRRAALWAGGLYAVSPFVLLSAGRVSEDVVITCLGMIGLTLLVLKPSHRWAALAGVCLGVACWVKYPALLYLPVYALAAPRRIWACLAGWIGAIAVLFAPFLGSLHALYDQSVGWQFHRRGSASLDQRLERVAVFWLVANPLAVAALARVRRPVWLLAGFIAGGAFALTSTVYYHYFVPIEPFAALLGGPLAARWVRVPWRAIALAALALAIVWAASIRTNGPGRAFVTAMDFSRVNPSIRLLQRSTPPGAPILGDRFEYAYLSGRHWDGGYYWNMRGLVTMRYLEHQASHSCAIIRSRFADPNAYPPGFIGYLNAHYLRRETGATTVWLTGHCPR